MKRPIDTPQWVRRSARSHPSLLTDPSSSTYSLWARLILSYLIKTLTRTWQWPPPAAAADRARQAARRSAAPAHTPSPRPAAARTHCGPGAAAGTPCRTCHGSRPACARRGWLGLQARKIDWVFQWTFGKLH